MSVYSFSVEMLQLPISVSIFLLTLEELRKEKKIKYSVERTWEMQRAHPKILWAKFEVFFQPDLSRILLFRRRKKH
jgi:hypothetical protein